MTLFDFRYWAPNLLTILALLPAAGALGDGWNEAVNGDLSGNYQSPTVINLDLGVNTIRATSGSTPSMDLEYFQLNVPAGLQIDAMILREFTSAFDSLAFIGVQPGTSFTFPAADAFTRAGELLGWAHFGPYEDTDFDAIGKDFLPQMGMNGPIGFSGPLTGPSYTFWAQQQGSATTYALEFVVSAGVPEPTTIVSAFVGTLLGMLGRQRNQGYGRRR